MVNGNLVEHISSMEDVAIVTYAASDKQMYIDGAVMLARSLATSVPSSQLVCIVESTMSQDDKNLLHSAGWNVKEVTPRAHLNRKGYFEHSFDKVEIFRLPFTKILYLDADTYVFGNPSELLGVLNAPLDSKEIKMVKDVMGGSYNSGVMVFHPSLDVYNRVFSQMKNGLLDQPAINSAYSGNIKELSAKFNTHGYGAHDSNGDCHDVVVAHFTGFHKPALADANNLEQVKDGTYKDQYSLSCPNLYQEYFTKLRQNVKSLSPALAPLVLSKSL